jgi:quercetin dioxygenase-like cupin family protein
VTEHLTVFRGHARVGPVGAPLTAGPGEHVSWSADTPHLYAASGSEDVEASLLIRTPVAPARRAGAPAVVPR